MKTALTELMLEKPFSQITIKDICERADLNRTTFYLHYLDQSALLKELEDEVLDNTYEYLKNVKPAEDAPAMIEAFLIYIRENSDLFKVLLLDAGSAGFRARFVESTLEKLRVNIPLTAEAEIEPYVTCFLMQGSVHMITTWIENGYDIPPKRLASLIFELCSRTAPGKPLSAGRE